MELARDIARTVADNGIDLFNVSVGLGETNRFTGPPPCLPKGWNADRAAAIKEALGDRALVGVAGRIIDRESADAVLNSGKADLVVIGRALIADRTCLISSPRTVTMLSSHAWAAMRVAWPGCASARPSPAP